MELYQWSIKHKFDVTNKITYNSKGLKSNLCDYNDAYILFKGNAIGHAATSVAFQNCAPSLSVSQTLMVIQ